MCSRKCYLWERAKGRQAYAHQIGIALATRFCAGCTVQLQIYE